MKLYAFTAGSTIVAAIIGLAVGELYLRRRPAPASSSTSSSSSSSVAGAIGAALSEGVQFVKTSIGMTYTPPAAAAPYLAHIAAAEGRHAIPKHLLARLLDQESRYRPDIIDGTVRSSAGAEGIAQIVRKWHPGVNPLDPFASIDYAANYLASLKSRLGSWEKALAAYNWGPSNVTTAVAQLGEQWLSSAPLETRNYVTQITGDVDTREVYV